MNCIALPATNDDGGHVHDGAGNEARTRDLNLGKVALYQLSYSRLDPYNVRRTDEPGFASLASHACDARTKLWQKDALFVKYRFEKSENLSGSTYPYRLRSWICGHASFM